MKFLIVKLQAIGDILMATPAIRLLKINFPDCIIHHLVLERYHEVTENNPFVDKVISFQENRTGFLSRLFGAYLLIRMLRKKKYDFIFAFQTARVILFFCRLLGAKRLFSPPRDMSNTAKNHSDIFKDLVIQSLTNIQKDINNNRLVFNKASSKLHFRNSYLSLAPYICIHPGGGDNFRQSTTIRRWPVGSYIELIRSLRSRWGLNIIITGNASDHFIARQIDVACPFIYNFCGKTNIDELTDIVENSILLITGDTGAMHLCGSTLTPFLALFGPTDPKQKLPMINNAFFISANLPCSPCYFGRFKGCTTGLQNCMRAISVEDVLEKAASILKNK